MICLAPRTLAALAIVAFSGCSRAETPAPEEPGPALTPASRPRTRPPTTLPCLDRFALLDRDGDGQLSAEEFEAHAPVHADPMTQFRLQDADGDNYLSEAEFCSGQANEPRGAPRRRQTGAMR
jgi:hypothetical protein